ncbi:MAG: ABC transporter substrate-binding protein [Acidimicrobiia bacterium]|nr:ABC transporter substrate-binding protein [Acidimicrobiia bacterium]
MRTSRKFSMWRRLVVVAVLAFVAAACTERTGDTATGETATTAPSGDDSTSTTVAPTAEGFTYKIGIVGDLTTDNFWAYVGPDSDVNNGYVLGQSHPALFTVAYPNILLAPRLADTEPNQAVQEGGVWVVEQTIRQGVKWSDGEEVTANDLVFTYEVMKELDLGGRWPEYFALQVDAVEDDPATDNVDESSPAQAGISRITAPDDYTVRIEFSEQPRLAVWQFGVGLAPFMPEHFWADKVVEARASDDPGAELYALSGEGEPSAGQMIYVGREPGAFAQNTMNTNDYYAGTTYTFYVDGSFRQTNDARGFDEVYNGSGEGEITKQWTSGPYASGVRYSIYADQNAAILALRNGEIDIILTSLGLHSGLEDQINAASNLNLVENVSNEFRYLAFNMRKSPMSYQGFRKAIGCVTDKEFMQTLSQGAAIATYGLVPPDNTFWANPDVEELCIGLTSEERFNRATKLLKTDGFTWAVEPEWNPENEELEAGTGTGLTDPEGVAVPELELLAQGPDFDPLRSTYSLWIAEWASNLGIPVKANPTGLRVIVDKAFALGEAALNWDMYILGWGLRDPALPAFHESFFASYQDSAQGGFNTPGYVNDRVDELVAELLAATDVETARAAVRELDRIIVEDAPYVVLYEIPIVEAYRNTLVFPFTDTLAGLQNLNGLPADVRTAD